MTLDLTSWERARAEQVELAADRALPDLQTRQQLGPQVITPDLLDAFLKHIVACGQVVDDNPLLRVNCLVLPTERKILTTNPLIAAHTGEGISGVLATMTDIQNTMAALMLPRLEAVLGDMLLDEWYGTGNSDNNHDAR
ncbi:hypothetical protein CCAX7_26300 [Capsulimonas corticalis]|uniref:Uncharacterized protein n=2 Tax=Capsulimonas corticalis TaxID=2219043 RepID=A0A402D6K6_9BACT|nr:hypothetical protein CCAX7_26300 [Capsulimonas corticalis]